MNHFALGSAMLLLGLLAIALPLWRRARPGMAAGGSRSAYEAAFAQAPNGILVVDGGSLGIVDANPAMQQTLGYSLAELQQLGLEEIFSDEGGPPDALLTQLRDSPARLVLETGQRCRDGRSLHVEISGYRLAIGERSLYALTTRDITMRRRVEAQLLEKQQHLDHLAHHDQLTGLPNRLFLAAHLPGAIEDAKRTGNMLAVLFLDLDRFKHINDSRGHETGDKLLKEVARRIRTTTRTDDIVVRMGGDEFIVILKTVATAEQINEAASRITEALAVPVLIDGRPLVTTASIGVSLFPRDGMTMGELLRQSDTAMYQAKDRGRNNFQLFSPVMERKLKERMAIESSLRTALQARQLDVHYQPIVDIESHRVFALEALLRWRHPAHGFVPPDRFVAVAEETGLIVPIGEFVLERVIEDAARWRSGGHAITPIAVNISAVQLQRSDLAATISRLTRMHGINPNMLQLELTESAVFERREGRNGESSQDAIVRLRELGARIAIDDFGTGYSSLSYLKRWRVDYLKIDRSFVRDLVTDMSDLAIVEAIIAMAKHLNIEVVAEGIEGWQQLEKLRQLGCSYAQGFLLARPAPFEQCHRYLNGEPLDLTSDDRVFETLEATGS
ncbi:MAG TPA: EAL domain-containing protein [Steroidobacteraceae bacterium]|nr:EAL domain-containing protein [Steroidobacteraceae bacterium]